MRSVKVHGMPNLDFDGHDTRSGAHALHPYAAKCPPQLVRYGLRYYSKPGETVLDPMSGVELRWPKRGVWVGMPWGTTLIRWLV